MIKDGNPRAATNATTNCIIDCRRYILILLGNANASEWPRWPSGVVVSLTFLRKERNRSRDRVSANLGRVLGRGYRCLVHYDTRTSERKPERWIGTCRDGKGMKFPPFTMSAINGRTALHPLQVSRFVARRALWASARFNRIIIGTGLGTDVIITLTLRITC